MIYYIEENKYRVIEHNGSFILQKADPNTFLTSSPPQIKWDYVGIVIKNTDEIDRLKDENARFRESLEYIDSQYNGHAGDIAREALKGGE